MSCIHEITVVFQSCSMLRELRTSLQQRACRFNTCLAIQTPLRTPCLNLTMWAWRHRCRWRSACYMNTPVSNLRELSRSTLELHGMTARTYPRSLTEFLQKNGRNVLFSVPRVELLPQVCIDVKAQGPDNRPRSCENILCTLA